MAGDKLLEIEVYWSAHFVLSCGILLWSFKNVVEKAEVGSRVASPRM